MTNTALQFNDAPAQTGHWRGIFFDGPQSDQNHDGDEIPAWLVYVGDDQAEAVGTVYKFHHFTTRRRPGQAHGQRPPP